MIKKVFRTLRAASYVTASVNSKVLAPNMVIVTVEGWLERKNEILFLPCRKSAKFNTVYFCGDVQDFHKNMAASKYCEKYIERSLEKTSSLLQRQFPDSNIVTVRPSRKVEIVHSCFDNFVKKEFESLAEFSPNHGSLQHLHYVITNLFAKLNQTERENLVRNNSFLPLRLIGFSRGCVVLNQIVYEMSHVGSHETTVNGIDAAKKLIGSLSEIYWLDSGHNGAKNYWITDRNVLQTLKVNDVRVEVHVTPYQIRCKLRPNVGREYKEFVNILRELKVNVAKSKVHFENVPGSITRHFNVLHEFKKI